MDPVQNIFPRRNISDCQWRPWLPSIHTIYKTRQRLRRGTPGLHDQKKTLSAVEARARWGGSIQVTRARQSVQSAAAAAELKQRGYLGQFERLALLKLRPVNIRALETARADDSLCSRTSTHVCVDDILVTEDVEQQKENCSLARGSLLVPKRQLSLHFLDIDVVRRMLYHVPKIYAPVLIDIHSRELGQIDLAVVVFVELVEEIVHGLGLHI